MAHTTINLRQEDAITVDVLPTPSAPFIALRLGDHITAYLPGYGEQAIVSARQIIAGLSAAINTIEQAQAPILKSAGAAIAGEPA